jgi:N12 class adenine-specific DNA methylase
MNTFYFPENQTLTFGSARQKAAENLSALRLLKEKNGLPASPEQQRILIRYTGWGDTAVYNQAAAELDGMLEKAELDALKASMLNAHYTSLDIIRAIWQGVMQVFADDLTGLRVLDPSAGIGHFRSLEPAAWREKSDWLEVELEPLTAQILTKLHPNTERSSIFVGGFENAPVQANQFDLVISNVPFSNYPVVDAQITDKRLKASVHDYFLCKAIDVTAPGGLVAIITSRYTLDKKDNFVRHWVARRADLLAAVRLPENTFQQNAGTQVVTDVLFLRKRENVLAEDALLPDWVDVVEMPLENKDGETHHVPVNSYYAEHPEKVLGKSCLVRGMYAPNEYTLKAEAGVDVATKLAETLKAILPKSAIRPAKGNENTPLVMPTDTHIIPILDSTSPRERKQLEALRELYDLARDLLESEIEGNGQAEALRSRLNETYDNYLLYYGVLTGKYTAKLLKDNPALPFLRALEVDTGTGMPRKAEIFSHSTVRAQRVLPAAPSAKDALLLSLDQFGEVDLDFICEATGLGEAQVLEELKGLLYKDPLTYQWQPANLYLSGNILEKIGAAKLALEDEPAFEENIAALRDAMPKPLLPGEIRARLGSGWIPTDVIQSFLEYLLEGIRIETITYVPDLGMWRIKAYDWAVTDYLLYSEWGTERRSALDLILNSLNAQTPIVYDKVDDRQVMNKDATIAAQAKLEKIEAAFEVWLWEDATRAERLAQLYNRLYNIYARPRFDGAHLTLPGMNAGITMRPHQLDAIWRILQERSVLLAHEVGLGKTLTSVAAIMELKRLGRINKAMVVVPNHLTLQWQEEALWAYPLAKILCAGPKDLSKAKRGEFLSRIATGDWDVVVVPESSFKLLPVGADALNEFLEAEIEKLRNFLYQNAEIGRSAEKQIQKAIKRFEAKLVDKASMRKDATETITWEMLGLDMLLVDEFHAYKNLFFATKMSRVAGLANTNSQRAFDMFIKSRFIQQAGGRFVGITATPVTNTLAEVFTLQRYFQYPTLERLGLTHFDPWAKLFAQAVALPEMSPEGGGFRINIRLAKFVNVPELSTLLSQFCEALKWEQVQTGTISRPALHQERPLIVELPSTPELEDYIAELAERATAVRNGTVSPEFDNMLKITSEGRKAALDMRLLNHLLPAWVDDQLRDENPDDTEQDDDLHDADEYADDADENAVIQHAYTDHPNSKAYRSADLIAAIYHATPHSRAAQVVFSDLGTPKSR